MKIFNADIDILNEIKKRKIKYKRRFDKYVNFVRIRDKIIIEYKKIIKHFKSKTTKLKKIVDSLKKTKTTVVGSTNILLCRMVKCSKDFFFYVS